MLLVKAWVGMSKIHGFGLIAHEFIPRGTIVWRLVPGFDVVLTDEELKRLPAPIQEHILYYGFFDPTLKKHILCADDDRFTNHSDDANLQFHIDHSVAIRDIHEGEEMTEDYKDLGTSINDYTRPPMVTA